MIVPASRNANCRPRIRQHRYHRVAEGVVPKHGAAGDALGARRADVVFAKHVEKRRAGNARKNSRLRQSQGDGWKGKRLQAQPNAGAPARKPARRHETEPDGEDVDQKQREPEIRHGDTELRRAHGNRVGRAAAPGGGEYADWNGDRRR